MLLGGREAREEKLGRHRERWVMMRYEQYGEAPGRTLPGGSGEPKTQLGNVCHPPASFGVLSLGKNKD